MLPCEQEERGLARETVVAGFHPQLPPAAPASVWSPPAMTPGTKAPAGTPAPSPMRTAVRRSPSRRRLSLAPSCRQRHGQAERHSPGGGIAD